MRARVQKWGNSLAVRIPKAFAGQLGLEENGAIDLVLVDGRVTIEPILPPTCTLDQLLAAVTPENLHAAIETGPPVGCEGW